MADFRDPRDAKATAASDVPEWTPPNDESASPAPSALDTSSADAAPEWTPDGVTTASAVAPADDPERLDSAEWADRAQSATSSNHRGTVTEAELKGVSARNGVSVERLRELTPWFGVLHKDSGPIDAAKAGLHGVFEVPLGGLTPQNLYKKLALPENEQRALDDVAALNRAKTSWDEAVVDTAAGVALPGGPATRAAKGLAAAVKGETAGAKAVQAAITVLGGAAEGAASGAAGSEFGKEGSSAVWGAAIGGPLAALSPIAQRVRANRDQAGRLAQRLATEADQSAVARASELAPAERAADDALWSVLKSPEARKAIREGETKALAESLPVDVRDHLFQMKRGQASADPIDDVVESLERGQKDLDRFSGRSKQSGATTADVEAIEPGRVEEAFRESRDANRLLRVLKRLPEASEGTSWLERQGQRFQDARYRFKDIDETFGGVGAEPELDRLSAGVNQAQADLAVALHEARPAIGLTIKATNEGSSPRAVAKLVESGDTPDAVRAAARRAGASEVETEAAVAWRVWYDSQLESASKVAGPKGGGPTKLTIDPNRQERGYLPARTVRPPEYIAKVADRAEEEFGLDLAKLDTDAQRVKLQGLADRAEAKPEGAEASFLKGLSLGDSNLPKTAADVRLALEGALDPERVSDRLNRFAKASLQRSGTPLPEWVREWDLGELAAGWAADTYTHLRTRDSVRRLNVLAESLSGAGAAAKAGGERDPKSAVAGQYVRDLLTDLSGSRKGTPWGQWRLSNAEGEADRLRGALRLEKAADTAQEAGQTFKAKSLRLRAAVARDTANRLELLSKATSWLYPTYLGASPTKAIRNATQFPLLALPELGSAYGAKVGVGALVRLAKEPRKYLALVKAEGLVSEDAVRGAEDAVRNGLARSSFGRGASWAGRAFSTLALSLYQASERANRVLTAAAADELADDAFRAVQHVQSTGSVKGLDAGATKAAALVRALGAGYRREVGEALKRGDRDGAAQSLRAYLNGKTQFNYNRASMSEFGREFGPLLSMFSKWPTSVGADVVDVFRKTNDADLDSFRRGQKAAKWLWPLAALASAEAVVRASGVRERVPATQLAVGSSDSTTSGFLGMHPLASLPLVTGRYLPPLLSEPAKVAGALLEGKPGKAAKQVGKSLLSVTPMGVFEQFASHELPLLRNRNPKDEE